MAGSSSRRSVVRAGLGLVASCLLPHPLGCRRREPDVSPWLTTAPPAESESDTAATRAAAFWVMVSSLSPAAGQRFVKTFDDVLAAAEATFDPLGLELGDDLDEAVRAFEIFLPQFNTAFALSAPSWPLPGEPLRVRATSAQPADGKARRAWGDDADSWARRLRFGAWAVSDALLLQASSAAEFARLVPQLRERAASERSALGAIVTSEMQKTFESVARRKELLELVARAQRLARTTKKKHRFLDLALSPIAAAEPSRVAPWLRLTALQCLLVPRLSAPNRRTALEPVLEEVLAGSQVVVIGGARSSS